jgi:hypothetical protein
MTPVKRKSLLRDRSAGGYTTDRLIVVATEGRKTEPVYLRSLRNSRLRLILVEDDEDKSAPARVLDRLLNQKSQLSYNNSDQYWIVCDVDHRKAKEITGVIREAGVHDVGIAWSSPRFELYLLFHFLHPTECPDQSEQITDKLKAVCPDYSPNNKARLPDRLLTPEAMRAAVANSKQSEGSFDPNNGYPHGPGSLVHRIVEQFL